MVLGGIIQLLSYGSQDIHLTGNPQMSYFKSVYKKYSNFSIETIEEVIKNKLELQPINNYVHKKNNRRVSCKLSKKGDLLKDILLELDITEPIIQNWEGLVKRPGLVLIDFIEFEIGGVVIDKLYGEWIDIYYQMCMNTDKYTKLSRLINGSLYQYKDCSPLNNQQTNILKFYIPIPFFFTKHYTNDKKSFQEQ